MTQSIDVTGITVVGAGRASAPPDVVRIDLAAESSAKAVQAALADATSGLARMRETLTALGIQAVDLRTTETSVHMDYGSSGRPQGYVARLGLSATVRDVGAAGAIVQDVLGSGGETARLSGLAFDHSDPSGLYVAAREAAVADARAKADQYAALAGRTLGEVTAVDETGGGGPVPVPRRMAAAVPMADLSVDGGQQEISVTVVVRWAWGA
ncbi:MAG: SIMPL domain-containing protein [Jiangellaceae bacterium]